MKGANAARKMVPKDTPCRAASNLKLVFFFFVLFKGSICEAKQSKAQLNEVGLYSSSFRESKAKL